MRHAYHQVDDQQAEKPKDQAIIISGESGAGKTEATKLIVQYLSWRSKAVHHQQDKRKVTADNFMASMKGPIVVPIEERIVSTTPLLEALGNARTLRNDNSSRFGKFMRLFMSDDGTLLACKIDQYLLEVTRVVKQASGENNFHILFQLIASISKDSVHHSARPSPPRSSPGKDKGPFANIFDASLLEMLDLREASHFHFLSRGGNLTVSGLTDKEGWDVTIGCLGALNLEPQEVTAMMRLLSAILHLGNIEISNPSTDWGLTDEEKAAAQEKLRKNRKKLTWKALAKAAVMDMRKRKGIRNKKEWGTGIDAAKMRANFRSVIRAALNEKAIQQTAQLLHIEPKRLQSAIRNRRIVLNDNSEITAIRSPADALAVRDAICKAIYSRLWTSVIRSLNSYLDCSKHVNSAGDDALEERHFIGLLDFAGFEHFFEHSNGFEQLLINYANEMLQWHFNCFIFQVEILEYYSEGIDTTEINFRDNEPCVHYIDNPYTGIISLLDDTCRQGDSGEINNDLHREKRFIRHIFDAFGNPKSDLGDMNESKPFYFKPRHDSHYCFGIKHYAGDVIYDSRDAWADKNSDALSHDAKTLIEDGPGNPYIRRVLKEGEDGEALSPNGGSDRKNRRKSAIFQRSVGRRFSDSLKKLIAALTACYPQFVRCIKPNHEKSPDIFAGFLTFRQLLNSGMIEAINARQAGFAVRIPHASFLYKFACLVKSARWTWHSGLSAANASSPLSPGAPGLDYSKLLTSQLAMMEEDEVAEAELKKRSDDFVGELGRSMSEVINHHSTRVGKTKVFMKATFAYTLHRIAEITEDHWVRKLQRVVRKYLALGARERDNARNRYRALLEAANAALAASRSTRPRRRANLAAETSITGFKRRLDNLSLGPAAQIYSSKLEAILTEVNSKMDSMMEQCKRIKKAEMGQERAETERIKRDIERLKNNQGVLHGSEPLESQGLPTREELDSPQLLYKFTRLMERQIGEAESLSRALGDALEERRQYQAKVWEIYEKFSVNESNAELRQGLRATVDQVLADADAALGTKFDVIEMDGLDGDRMLDRRMAVLIAHKELSNHEREMLSRRRMLKQTADEQEGQKTRIDALDKEYRAVLEQVELFMELCQSVGAMHQLSSNGLMSHMQRVHHAVEAAEAALEKVMVKAERSSAQSDMDMFGRSRSADDSLDSLCKSRISDAASVVQQEMVAVKKLCSQKGNSVQPEIRARTSSNPEVPVRKDEKSEKKKRRDKETTPPKEKSESRRRSSNKEKRKSSDNFNALHDNDDGLIVMASLDISSLSMEAQAKASSPNTKPLLSRSAKSTGAKSPASKAEGPGKPTAAAEEVSASRRSSNDLKAEKKRESREKANLKSLSANEGIFVDSPRIAPRTSKKSTPVYKTPFEYGLPATPSRPAEPEQKQAPPSAQTGPSVKDMASKWQRPTLAVATNNSPAGTPDLTTSPGGTFEGRLAVQEERRKRLDEIQAARDKEANSDHEDDEETAAEKVRVMVAEAMAKEQAEQRRATKEPMSPRSPALFKSQDVSSMMARESPPLDPSQRPETPDDLPPPSESESEED